MKTLATSFCIIGERVKPRTLPRSSATLSKRSRALNKPQQSDNIMNTNLLGIFLMSALTLNAQTINFDTERAGEAPKGWTFTKTGQGNPKWTVETDDTAPSKPNVL